MVEGRQVITGRVVSVKWQDNDFGGRFVMTVKEDRGFLVWGTVPASLGQVERDARVTFTATVEKSDRDDTCRLLQAAHQGQPGRGGGGMSQLLTSGACLALWLSPVAILVVATYRALRALLEALVDTWEVQP